MRTYDNFLMFEDALTNLPTSSAAINSLAAAVINPKVTIVMGDCNTAVGQVINLGTTITDQYSVEGQTLINTQASQYSMSSPLSVPNIVTLLSGGVTQIQTRSIGTCAAPGGVCQNCYQATTRIRPYVGTSLVVPNDVIFHTDIITSNPNTTTYSSTDTTDYKYTNYNNTGMFFQDYSSSGLNIVTSWSGQNLLLAGSTYFALHYFTSTTDHLLNYFAKSYSGALFGIAPLITYPMIVKPSLIQANLTQGLIQAARSDLTNFTSNVPPPIMQYCDTIKDTLERALFIVYLYAFFGN